MCRSLFFNKVAGLSLGPSDSITENSIVDISSDFKNLIFGKENFFSRFLEEQKGTKTNYPQIIFDETIYTLCNLLKYEIRA